MTPDQLPLCLLSNLLVSASSPYLLHILKYQLCGRLERTLMESENKEERGKTGKGCRKRELIHQPNSQGEQNCQVGTCREKDRRVVRREGGQQSVAALHELHLFIPAAQTTHPGGKGEVTGTCMNSMPMG